MTYETIKLLVDPEGRADLILARAQKRNAMSATMIEELTECAHEIGSRSDIRVVVLRGEGSYFCAGGDLEWMMAQINADRTTRMKEARKLAMMLFALNKMPKPMIAQIHGGAFGGGIGLACVADEVISEKTAKFGFTETRLGIIPATIGPYVIARMGEGSARRVFMSAHIFGADEAQNLGIVSSTTSEEMIQQHTAQSIAPYLQTDTHAVGAAKKLALHLGSSPSESKIDYSINALADVWESESAKERIAAFLAKQK